MAQIVTRLDDSLAAQADLLIDDGVVASRSEAVRLGLELIVEKRRRETIAASIVTSFSELPQSQEALVGAEESTRAMIEEEPW